MQASPKQRRTGRHSDGLVPTTRQRDVHPQGEHGTRHRPPRPGDTRDPEDTLGVPADQRIGLTFQGVRDGNDVPVQVWSSGSGHYEVHVTDDGETSFFKDGDLHRHGGPAVVTADGDKHWFDRGRHVPVVPESPHDDATRVGTSDETHRYIGTHHVHGDDVARTARRLRKDMKALSDVGHLPDGATVNVEGHRDGTGPSPSASAGCRRDGRLTDSTTHLTGRRFGRTCCATSTSTTTGRPAITRPRPGTGSRLT